LNPSWVSKNEEFLIVVPLHRSLQDCVLELQVYDFDKFSENDLLGVRSLTGMELSQFFQTAKSTAADNSELQRVWKGSGCEFVTSSRSVFFPLQKSDTLKHQVTVKGDIELAVQPADQIPIPVLGSFPPSNFNSEIWRQELASSANSLELYNSHPTIKYTIFIVSAKNLGNADTFGKR
jgi:hypothetical protein